MAINDFGVKGKSGQSDAQHESEETAPKQKDGTPSSQHDEIKNAHASGDGSFGRSESSLPDEEEGSVAGNAY